MTLASDSDAAVLQLSKSETGDASGISQNASGTCPHFGHERAEADLFAMLGLLLIYIIHKVRLPSVRVQNPTAT